MYKLASEHECIYKCTNVCVLYIKDCALYKILRWKGSFPFFSGQLIHSSFNHILKTIGSGHSTATSGTHHTGYTLVTPFVGHKVKEKTDGRYAMGVIFDLLGGRCEGRKKPMWNKISIMETSNKILLHSSHETLDLTDLSPVNDLRVLVLRDFLDLRISRREKEKEERKKGRKGVREGGRRKRKTQILHTNDRT